MQRVYALTLLAASSWNRACLRLSQVLPTALSSAFAEPYREVNHHLLHVPTCKHSSSCKDQSSASLGKVQAWKLLSLKQLMLWNYKNQEEKF